MTRPQPQNAPRPYRACIIQDVPDSAIQQRQLLEDEAKKRGLDLEIELIELREPASRIMKKLTSTTAPYDWVISDLLISPIDDHSPMTSAGLNILRQTCRSGFFHGYNKRDARNAEGVRCIAVYSASLADYGGQEREINKALDELGVDENSRFKSGEMTRVAAHVCDELIRNEQDVWK